MIDTSHPLGRRRLIASASVATAFSALAARSSFAQGTQRGRTLVANIVPEPQSLVGGVAISAPAVAISTNIFDALFEYDAEFKPQPALATGWEEKDDGRTLVLTLRKGVTWHDGKPFTSADVQYSLLELMKKVHPRGGAFFSQLTAVDTPDPHVAVLRFTARAPVVWSVLNYETQILPRHLYEGTNILTNPYNVKPVGTGPFVFKEWVRGDYVLVERNPNYWDKDRPGVDRIRFRFIPDSGARAAALETGEVHYTPLSPVPLADVPRLKDKPGLVVETRGSEANAPVFFLDFNLRRPQFQDVRVRRAIAHAIDRTALANTVWFGFATPATGPIPSYQKQFYTADVPQYPFDPAHAEQLLDEAGYRKGSDGIRLRISHDPMPYGDEYARSGEFIRQALKQVGIEVTLRNHDLPTFLRKVFTERDFDTLNSFYAAFPDPQIGVHRRFSSEAIKTGTPWSNASGYSRPETDALIGAIQTEGDVARRVALIHQLQQVAQTDLPSITLLELLPFRVYSARLAGVNVNPDGGGASLKNVSFAS
jgi:peptide/nickel transport system substrate-binding protein